jgi:hexosaminidase
MMALTLHWKRDTVTGEIAQALDELAREYPLLEGPGEPTLEFVADAAAQELQVARAGESLRITYATVSDALRGVGAALAGLPETDGVIEEKRPFAALGIMLDCSRNAVMKVEHIQKWLRRLALFGYNMMMLYTEDTYRLPDEPFFGFFRGAYSPEDLRAVDECAARLGIEVIGCIQTLGHLEQILKWGAYSAVRDTRSVILAEEPKTYDLIRKMIACCAQNLRSRRIHIGMDEAHDLGRGRYMDLHGYRRAFDIFNQHLDRVIGICREHNLKPMIWSDMYFRMGSKTGDYYDKEAVIPPDVKAAISPDVELVYWDYYHSDEQTYRDFVGMHRELGKEPVMGSGIWTWGLLWYDRRRTEANVPPCVKACRRERVRDVFFTMWGDDGAYCEFDSALAGIAFTAAEVFGERGAWMRKRFEAVCGIGYDAVLAGCELEKFPGSPILWDDPLFALHWHARRANQDDYWEQALAHYRRLARRLSRFRDQTEPVDMAHAALLARYLAAKIEFRARLEDAYFARDNAKLEAVVKDCRRMIRLTEKVAESFRRQWLQRNRRPGLEVLEARLGGIRQRYGEVAVALSEILSGTSASIFELDEGRAMSADALAKCNARGFRGLISPSAIT